jgi:acyl-CoA synthetase (NDP forming)
MALLATSGGGAPILRGALEAFRAIAQVADWEARQASRSANGPWRPGWPELARDRTSYGLESGAGVVAAAGQTGRRTALSERASLAIVGRAGVPVVEATPVVDAGTAVAVARRLGRPVALKVEADGLTHKSDIGGVALGLHGDDAVYAAALRLFEDARRRGLDVRGLIVGLRRDPQFGPVVLVGLGGVLAEFLDDVAIRLAPIGEETAMAMLDDLRGAALLRGVRGRAGVDRAALARMLVALGDLGLARPDIVEIDLNPVIASPRGAIAVDALVVVADGASS